MILPTAIRTAIAHHVDSTWYLRGGIYHVQTHDGRVTRRGDCICPPRWMRDFSRTRTTTWGVVPNEHAHLFGLRPDADHASTVVPVDDWTMVERFGYYPDGGRNYTEWQEIARIRALLLSGCPVDHITLDLNKAGVPYRDGGHTRRWTDGRVLGVVSPPDWDVER